MRTWSSPRPFVEFRELSLLETDEVDAVAYDRSQNILLFSTEKAPVEEQLKILCLGPDLAIPVNYEDLAGNCWCLYTRIGDPENFYEEPCNRGADP